MAVFVLFWFALFLCLIVFPVEYHSEHDKAELNKLIEELEKE